MGQVQTVYSEYYTVTTWENWSDPWELIRGQPYSMSPSPSFRHQDINSMILYELIGQLKPCGKCKAVMPVDWQISEDTVVQPDLVVVCKNIPINRLTSIPSAIFEILSPSTRKKDQTIKFDLYETQGVTYYVMVNPDDESVEFYRLNASGKYEKQDTGPVLFFDFEGCKVELDVAKIW